MLQSVEKEFFTYAIYNLPLMSETCTTFAMFPMNNSARISHSSCTIEIEYAHQRRKFFPLFTNC